MELLSNTPAYWFNWRVFLCFLFLLTPIYVASYIIRKYERPNVQRSRNEEEEEDEGDTGVLFEHELWKTCWRKIHPAWLMGYRIFAFIMLLLFIALDVAVCGWSIFYSYSEWTLTLLIIYFGLGSYISINGRYRELSRDGSGDLGGTRTYRVVGFVFQIIYQILAGAVVLTDCVYYYLNAPYLATKSTMIFYYLGILRHSINVVFLLGDAVLNSMRFPLFRMAYFGVWTCVFVFFHWILHASIPIWWWPTTFLNLSHPLAPLWYLLMILFHIPCYGVFFLLVKVKHFLLKTFLRDG